MMQFFRGRLFKRFVMWFMAVVFAVMFGMVVSGLRPDTLFTGGVQWVLKVNGQKVDAQQYQQALRQASDRSQDLLRAGQDVDIPGAAQDSLIQRALLVSYARERKLVPVAKELREAVQKSPELADDFRPYGLAFSSAQAIEVFADTQAIQGVRDLLQGLPVVTDAEIERDFVERNTKAKLRYIDFQHLKYESDVVLSDDDLRGFYDANRDLFWRGATVDVEFLKLNPELARSSVEVTDDEVRAYYDQQRSSYETDELNARHILRRVESDATPEQEQQVREKAQEILDLANQPDADFEALAREYSEDTGSGAGGGDLSWFSRGDMVPSFENAAFALSEDRPLSGLVKTQYGYHIIQYVDRRMSAKPLSEVRGEIENTLYSNRARDKTAEDAEELFFEVDAEGIDAALALERYAPYEPSVQQTGFFSQADASIPSVGSSYLYGDFVDKAFEMRVGEWSEPIEVKQARASDVIGYFMLRVRDRRPAGVEEFDEAKSDVEELMKEQRAPQLAMEAAQRLWALYEEGDDVDALAAKHQPDGDTDAAPEPRETGDITTTTIGYVPRMDYCRPAMVAAFQMDLDEMRGVYKGQRAAYIIQLVERTDADLADLTDAERANTRDRLLSSKRRAAEDTWYQDLRDSAEIERNAELLAGF